MGILRKLAFLGLTVLVELSLRVARFRPDHPPKSNRAIFRGIGYDPTSEIRERCPDCGYQAQACDMVTRGDRRACCWCWDETDKPPGMVG